MNAMRSFSHEFHKLPNAASEQVTPNDSLNGILFNIAD
jgi:hypothetical protein